jgi:tetratricopeptide (TPR) repeat protein
VGFLVIAATSAVYVNAYNGAFLFDDAVHILQNAGIRRLWPLATVLQGRRPLVDLTLAANYRLGGFEPQGYHVVNIAIHALAALALYGVVRQTLLRSSHRENSAWGVSWVALAAALIWAAHPLQTQSVTYLIQRSESMMGLFYLLTLYCVIRGAGSTDWTSKPACHQQAGLPPAGWLASGPTGRVGPTYKTCWYIAAVLCCALGMGSKGVMVTAPVVVLLYDRAFLGGSFVEALRRRWGLYASLAATWAVLWACGVAGGVLDPSRKSATMGFSLQEITPWQYAATQPGVILHYLTLSLWPHPLCLDYSWPVARTADAMVLPGVLVGLLLAATAWALLRRPRLGFPGVWFFVILAPTSSVIPIKDTLFEHRMYLSLAAVVVLLVVGSDRLLRQLVLRMPLVNSRRRLAGGALVVAAAAVLAVGTIRRNRDYREAVSMWQDVVAKRPWNARAFEQLGTALIAVHNKPDAITAYRHAVRVDPDFASAHANLGNALSETGRFEEAVTHYSRARRFDPQRVDVCINLAFALEQSGRIEEAIATYRDAARIEPHPPSPRTSARAHYNLADLLRTQGRLDEAVTEYRKAVRLWSHYEKAHFALGWVLALQGQLDEAVNHFERTLQINPNHTGARNARTDALRKLGSPDSD